MKINNTIKIVLTCLIAFAVAAYVFFRYYSEKNESSNSEGFRHLRVEAIQKETGWGYRIYQDTSAIIEQLYIPGLEGSKGFNTKADAQLTGSLVQRKLQKGIFPPTIRLHELDSMGINYK